MSESTGDTASRPTGVFWGKKCYVIITGASAGIGRAIAVAFSKEVAENSVFVITGRNSERLTETKRLVSEAAPRVQVVAHTTDHSKATFEDYRKLISDTWPKISGADGVILVHNVGTLGDVQKYAISYTDEKEIDDYFHLNVTSVMTLTSAFLEKFPSSCTVPRVIVNITSLAAVKAMAGTALYCTGKAAREMYLNVIAAEDPSLTILHYSPGPVDTAMHHELRSGVKEAAAVAFGARDSGMLLTPEATVLRLVQVLRAQEFKSGDHVDYFDRKIC
uniref:Sepiapterin reductase n=1 Tax=Amblyomma tuberculatum TaxID=48802 RepID=A0A6M2E5G1_9ACAR